jgi:ribosomal protein S18 acetylase RimI-like enzyme
MSDVTIRPATDADMPAVARIWRRCQRWAPLAFLRRR